MAKEVGLSRSIKLTWLNKAAEYVEKYDTEKEYKEAVNEYLSFEIKSPTVLRKTREILAHVWDYNEIREEGIHNQALKLIKEYPDYALQIHWGLLLIAYPVFVDVCSLISKLSVFQENITLKQLRTKLYDEWGERATLFHSLDKIIATMKNLDVIEAEKPGVYKIKKHSTTNRKITNYMLLVSIGVNDDAYVRFQNLKEIKCLFPFDVTVSKEQIMEDDRFAISNIGGELTVGLK